MRIAAVQLDPGSHGRAGVLREAISALERAGESEPTPDVCVLPAFIDVFGSGQSRPEQIEPLYGPTTISLSAATRELGLHAVFGLAAWDGDDLIAACILMDADGDILSVHRQIVLPARERGVVAAGEALTVCDTMLGRIGLLMRDDLWDDRVWRQAAEADVDCILGCAARWPSAEPDPANRIAEQARQAKTWTAVSGLVTPEAVGGACIADPKGHVAARIRATGTQVCVARTDVRPRQPS
ncbi:MAG: carbon-nitrogen hydrolase family protein [Phycisphaerae bacterium]